MKKFFLLVSALGACAAVQAQSSVTLFGVADATLAYGNGSITNRTQMLRGGTSSNRIGFRGTEDLGGGLSAGFWLEGGFNLDEGTGLASSTNNQTATAAPAGGLTFNRRASVSLAGAWGFVAMGREYVPTYATFTALYEPFGIVGVGAAVNYTAGLDKLVVIRASNAIVYQSPRFAGVGLNLGHWRGENAGGSPTADDGTGSAIRLSYDQGPLSTGAAWSRTSYAAGDLEMRHLAAAWNFGAVKVSGIYNDDRRGTVHAKGALLGITSQVGAGEGVLLREPHECRRQARGPQARLGLCAQPLQAHRAVRHGRARRQQRRRARILERRNHRPQPVVHRSGPGTATQLLSHYRPRFAPARQICLFF